MRNTEQETALRVVIPGVPKTLFYRFNEKCRTDIGDEVLVELGRRITSGWVVGRTTMAEAAAELARELAQGRRLRSAQRFSGAEQLSFLPDEDETKSLRQQIKAVYGAYPVFLPQQLSLFEWMADYYGTSLCEILECALPKRRPGRKVLCAEASKELRLCVQENKQSIDELLLRAPLQAKIAQVLCHATEALPLSALQDSGQNSGSAARSALLALEKKGLVVLEEKHICELSAVYNKPVDHKDRVHAGLAPQQLTVAQQHALDEITTALGSGKFHPFLLFGVTGSGKTEVYIRAIAEVLKQGGSALVIVPEIALTPQFIDQFHARLNVPLALLHSQVGTTARWEAWAAVLQGKVRVALGARSAVFAPLHNMSLIIVDEEHEASYKQGEGLRYQARDVAVMRSKFAAAVVVLGSATPSLESLLNVQKKRYRLLELPERATSRPLPTMEIVDLNQIKRRDMPSENISPQLFQSLKNTLDSGGQAVILYNRRGFASYLQCQSCSDVVICPNCSVPLTLHRRHDRLLCHYCNLSMITPAYCSFCRDHKTTRIELDCAGAPLERSSVIEKQGKLVLRGAGTEKVLEELAELFPQANILRMDRDAVRHKGAYREILGSMRSGKAQILVGTQMIAKGHDLPGVTLVGIISADVGLHLPDFRASEKAYQLITQAAGRSGRGEEAGLVLVQTREPRHPTIVAALSGRFKAFARYELEYRRSLSYPPMGRLLRLIISCPSAQDAYRAACFVRDSLNQLLSSLPAADDEDYSKISVLGPAPAPHEKLCGRFRWHILLKAQSARQLSQIASRLNAWKSSIKEFKDFRLVVDVDPVDML